MRSRLAASVALLFSLAAINCYGENLCLEYSQKGEYDKAIAACTELISKPDFSTYIAYDNRGFAYSKKGQYDKAIADFTKAIELNPKDTYAYNNRGFAYGQKGQHDKAIEDSTKAIELEPRNALSYQSRALAYEGDKKPEKALVDWSKAIELAPSEYNYLNRARIYRYAGRYDEAISDYGKLIELKPARPTGYWFRAAAYYEAGKFGKDIQDYRKLMKIYSKDYPDIRLDLLYVRLLNAAGKQSKGEYNKVLKEMREYVSSNTVSSDDERWWRAVSQYYLGAEGMSGDKLLSGASNSVNKRKTQERICDAYYAMGEKRYAEGDRKGAEEFFSKSIETGVYSYSSRFAEAMLRLMKEGKI
jgi:tetratricopeptide (TPR) repeat protein